MQAHTLACSDFDETTFSAGVFLDGCFPVYYFEMTILFAVLLGLVFGLWDLYETWRHPLAEDSPLALLKFYGPMFAAWGTAGFIATRRRGRIREGLKTATVVAFVTFVVFHIANLIRVNLFLETLGLRADWQNMVLRFDSSGWTSLRAFVNYDYLTGAPFKLCAASVFGAACGFLGGAMAHLTSLYKAKHNRSVPL